MRNRTEKGPGRGPDRLPFDAGMSNERTHYLLPKSKGEANMILYRSDPHALGLEALRPRAVRLVASRGDRYPKRQVQPDLHKNRPAARWESNVYLTHNPVTPVMAPAAGDAKLNGKKPIVP